MIFTVTRTNGYKHSLLEDYPILSKYNYHDEQIVFWHCEGKIVINSLEELVLLAKEVEQPLIVDTNPLTIEIYDDWRE